MVKWIERVEFIPSEKQVGGEREGGKNEDDEYFDLPPTSAASKNFWCLNAGAGNASPFHLRLHPGHSSLFP